MSVGKSVFSHFRGGRGWLRVGFVEAQRPASFNKQYISAYLLKIEKGGHLNRESFTMWHIFHL